MASKEEFVLIRIIDSYEYSPLSRSVKFAELISKLDDKKRAVLLEGFAKFLCAEFVGLVKKSIDTQKFKVAFHPLSAKYVDFKRKNKLEDGFWRSTRYLVDHIKWWKYSGEYSIGFAKKLCYPEDDTGVKGVQVLMVAKTLEFGNDMWRESGGRKGTPPRPVFRPIASYISKNITRFLEKYLDTIDFRSL